MIKKFKMSKDAEAAAEKAIPTIAENLESLAPTAPQPQKFINPPRRPIVVDVADGIKGSDTLDILTPVLWLGVVTGCLPFKGVFDRENGKQVAPTFRLVSFPTFWWLLSFSFQCVLSVYNISGIFSCCSEDVFASPEFAMKLNVALHNTMPLLAAACILGHAETLTQHFYCWPEIDMKLAKKNRRHRVFVWIILLQLLIHMAPSWYNNLFTHIIQLKDATSVSDVSLLPLWVPFIVQSLISNTTIYTPVAIFCTCAISLASKFTMVKDRIQQLIIKARNDGQPNQLSIKELEELRILHCKLRVASKSLCEALSPSLMIVLTALTMLVFDQAYMMLADTEAKKDKDNLTFIISTSLTMFLSGVIIIYLAYCADETADESVRALPVLQSIPVLGLPPEVREEVVAFQHDVASCPVQFSASGFFPIDKEMLTKVVGGCVTLLIVVLQVQFNKTEETASVHIIPPSNKLPAKENIHFPS